MCSAVFFALSIRPTFACTNPHVAAIRLLSLLKSIQLMPFRIPIGLNRTHGESWGNQRVFPRTPFFSNTAAAATVPCSSAVSSRLFPDLSYLMPAR